MPDYINTPVASFFRQNAGMHLILTLFTVLLMTPSPGLAQAHREITDAAGRILSIPAQVDRVICSGSGCLRLLTYLQAHDRIVAVDSIELRGSPIDARPYAIANPQFKTYPLFGEFRGQDTPELIAALTPQPQVIFKTYALRDGDPDRLQAKTGIPVITLEYGNLTHARKQLNQALRLMGLVMGAQTRAEEVIAWFDDLEADLRRRTQDIPDNQRPACYVGGLGQRGPHGFQSTETAFAPFVFTGARNVTSHLFNPKQQTSHANVSKEKILMWNPEVIFIDVSTMRLESGTNALFQVQTDPIYQTLDAVQAGHLYGLFPYNSYTENFESIFANAYYVGKVLYPDRFEDVDPLAKAEEFSIFLNGGPAFKQMNQEFGGMAFSRIELQQ